jgi:hypothetical protein
MSPEVFQALFWFVRVCLMTAPSAYLVAKGVIRPEDQADFASNATTILFGLGSVAGIVWSWLARRKRSIIARIADMPDIHSIHADQALADSIPSDKVRAP